MPSEATERVEATTEGLAEIARVQLRLVLDGVESSAAVAGCLRARAGRMSNLTPKEARELWATELESGKWKQGDGQLAREADGYRTFCCLGVACELAVREGIIDGYKDDAPGLHRYDKVKEWLGIATDEGDYGDGISRCLASDNDAGASFTEIAATIRAEPEGLVVA